MKRLNEFAIFSFHTAYEDVTMSLHKEWQFVQSVTSGVGAMFAPLEAALIEYFIPALLGGG